jgi:diguanylate cyclase (GGDEF)-like protein
LAPIVPRSAGNHSIYIALRWHAACTLPVNLEMLLYKIGLAIGVVLLLCGTALISASSTTDPHIAYTFIALLAFGLELADGSTMGFVFILLALPQLNWLETLLMAGSAQMILITVRRQRADPKTLLHSLAANSAAVLATQLFYHAPNLQRVDAPIRLMLASGVCFLCLRFLDVTKRDIWSFPYYPVASAIGVLFPISAVLPPLVYFTWRSCRLYERRLKKQRQHSRDAASLHLRTIETLALAIEARDQPASRKPHRVQVYCVAMAKELGLKETEVEGIRAASLLYDIGEMAVPENIILKPGPLTPDEYEKVKIHPAVGAEILDRVKFPYPVAPIVLAHHERWDGAGYPNGLRGEQIPLGARLLAVADAFDALISARHHRSAVSIEEALAHLEAESGRAYDPRMVALLRNKHKQWEKLASSPPERGFVDAILLAQREVKVVTELTQKLGSSLELSETFASLKPGLRALIHFETLAVWVEREGALLPEFVAGDHLALWSSLRIPMGGGVSGVVAAERKFLLNGNAVSEFARLPLESWSQFRYVMAAPLDFSGLRGTLSLYRSGEQKFTPEDGRILAAMAPKIAMAVANGLKFQKTTNQAATDGLTGLPNASALFARMEAALPPVVLICDLDGFKSVNDRFGHVTGNQVLEALAAGFKKSCRIGDFVARMGGDEFVLLLNEMRPEEIGSRIEQFRGMVRSVGREITGADVLDASFGIALHPENGTTPNELLAFADQQMYRRKSEQKAGVRRFEKSA